MDPNTGTVQPLEDILGRVIKTLEDRVVAERMAHAQGLVVVDERVAVATTVGLLPQNRAARRRERRKLRRNRRAR